MDTKKIYSISEARQLENWKQTVHSSQEQVKAYATQNNAECSHNAFWMSWSHILQLDLFFKGGFEMARNKGLMLFMLVTTKD